MRVELEGRGWGWRCRYSTGREVQHSPQTLSHGGWRWRIEDEGGGTHLGEKCSALCRHSYPLKGEGVGGVWRWRYSPGREVQRSLQTLSSGGYRWREEGEGGEWGWRYSPGRVVQCSLQTISHGGWRWRVEDEGGGTHLGENCSALHRHYHLEGGGGG